MTALFRRFPVTAFYLLAIIVMHLLVTFSGGSDSLGTLVRWGALVAPYVHRGEYWRLLTPVFLHGGLLHLFFNGFALYQLGPICEFLFGSFQFAWIFLVCGIGGSLLSITVHPDVVAVGASGAIFGLAGLLLSAALKKETRFSTLFRRSLLQSMGPFVAYNLFLGFAIPGIDNFGHIGGLLTGALLGLAVQPAVKRR